MTTPLPSAAGWIMLQHQSVGVQRYVGTSTSSPLRQSPNREEIDEAGVEDFQSQSYRPFTQDAALLHVNYHDDAASSTPERHENSNPIIRLTTYRAAA